MTPSHPGRPPHLLIVDDEHGVREFASRALRTAGYEVTEALSGAEALNMAAGAEPPFDLFVIDLVMPAMFGDELARRLRRRDPEAKVLYFTGYSARLFDERHKLGEHEAFLEKPVTIKGLLEAVSLLLFGHLQGPNRDD